MKSRVRSHQSTGGNNLHRLSIQGGGNHGPLLAGGGEGSGRSTPRSILQAAGSRTMTPRSGTHTPIVHTVDPHSQHALTHTLHDSSRLPPQVLTVHSSSSSTEPSTSSTAVHAALPPHYRHPEQDEDYAHSVTVRTQRYENARLPVAPTPKNFQPPNAVHTNNNPNSILNRRVKSILAGLRSRFFHAKGSMRQTFRSWDTNANGTLDAKEIEEALCAMGYAVTTEEARGIIKAFDGNADGVVQYEDFVSILCGNDNDTIAVTASDGQVGFIRGNSSVGDINTGVTVLSNFAGNTLKKTLGPQELTYRRHTSFFDAADGRGSDTIAESVRLTQDRHQNDLRSQFTNAIIVEAAQNYSTALAKESGLALDTVRSTTTNRSTEDGSSVESIDDNSNQFIDYSTMAQLGPASEAALIASGIVPTLPLNTLRKRTNSFDENSSRNSHTKHQPQEWFPRQRSMDLSLTARSRIPRATEPLTGPMSLVDSEMDPLTAEPDTGRGTIVIGTVGGESNRSTLQQIVNKSIAKVHRTAPGPLDHMFPSAPVPLNKVREERFRNRQLEWQRRTGKLSTTTLPHSYDPSNTTTTGVSLPPVSSSHHHHQQQKQQQYEFNDNNTVTVSSSSGGVKGIVNSLASSSSLHPTSAGSATQTFAGEVKMADKIRKAREEKMARLGLDSVNSGHNGSGGVLYGHVAAANDLRQRMVRAEGQRTSYLIAPPPTVFTSHSSENPEWHYASISRIQQTGRKIPEQVFDGLIGADRTKNIQDALADYTARVQGNIDGAAEIQRLSEESRVEAKRTLRNAYREAVSQRLAKEAVIFGGDEPLKVQW